MNHDRQTGQGSNQKNESTADNSFFEQVAMGGPGLSLVIRGNDTKIIFANSLFEKYTGYSKSSLADLPFTGLMEPYQHDRFFMQLADVRHNVATPYSFVIYHLLKKDGATQPFSVYASPLAGSSNDSAGLFQLLLIPDESKLGMPFTSQETKERCLEHFDTEGHGTFEWMLEADKIFWSRGIYEIYEVDQEVKEIDHFFTFKFVHPQDIAFVKECLENAIRDCSDMGIEFRIITAKNNVKVLHCLARVITGSEGKPAKFAGSIRDITRQRAIEDSLKNKVKELHHSNRELEEFAYAASHDMQEPLRKITTFSGRLSAKYQDALAEEGNMYLSRMVAAAENMRLLINGLLEFSKISKTSAPYESTDLNAIVQQVMTDLELKMEETGTAIYCTNLPRVMAVASQMKQLLVNLIGNAIKFHKQGVAPVINIEGQQVSEEEVRSHGLDGKKSYHKIVVTDNGIGFENEYANRIFQVFQRLHGKSEYPGSGIGLAICKKILEYHHGVIYAENADGRGARFVFILPQNQ